MPVLVMYLVKYHYDQKAAMLAIVTIVIALRSTKTPSLILAECPSQSMCSYGEYDRVYTYEMPDDKALAANLHLTDSLGLAKYCKTIPLMAMPDFVESMRLANDTKPVTSRRTMSQLWSYLYGCCLPSAVSITAVPDER